MHFGNVCRYFVIMSTINSNKPDCSGRSHVDEVIGGKVRRPKPGRCIEVHLLECLQSERKRRWDGSFVVLDTAVMK